MGGLGAVTARWLHVRQKTHCVNPGMIHIVAVRDVTESGLRVARSKETAHLGETGILISSGSRGRNVSQRGLASKQGHGSYRREHKGWPCDNSLFTARGIQGARTEAAVSGDRRGRPYAVRLPGGHARPRESSGRRTWTISGASWCAPVYDGRREPIRRIPTAGRIKMNTRNNRTYEHKASGTMVE